MGKAAPRSRDEKVRTSETGEWVGVGHSCPPDIVNTVDLKTYSGIILLAPFPHLHPFKEEKSTNMIMTTLAP